MFEGAFSFYGRIGRLGFLLSSLITLPLAAVAAFGIAFTPMGPRGMVGSVILLCLAFAWYSLSLYVRRIRDIGWDPFMVLVGVAALNFGDVILAKLVPSMAVTDHSTAVASLVNSALSLALLFWPGHEADQSSTRHYRFG